MQCSSFKSHTRTSFHPTNLLNAINDRTNTICVNHLWMSFLIKLNTLYTTALHLCAEFFFLSIFFSNTHHSRTWNENWPTGSATFLWILILKMCFSFTFLSPSIQHIDKTPAYLFVVDDEHVLLYVLFMPPIQDQKIVSTEHQQEKKFKSHCRIFTQEQRTKTQKKNVFHFFRISLRFEYICSYFICFHVS